MTRHDPHMPDVSVVVPAFNPGHFLRTTLDSLVAQTHTDWEAVVVDDGSTEDLTWVLEVDDRIRMIRQPNMGLSAARNAAIRATSAPLIAFLDHDDYWLPSKLQRQVERLEQDKALGLLSTRFAIIDGLGKVLSGGFEGHHDSYAALLGGCGICVSTVIVRRSVLDRTGVFATDLQAVQDWDLWLRIAAVARISRVDELLAQYRIHSGGMSQNWRRIHDESLAVLAKHPGALAAGGRQHVRRLAAYQAFDAARAAVRSRRMADAARSLGFVASRHPGILGRELSRRIAASLHRPGG